MRSEIFFETASIRVNPRTLIDAVGILTDIACKRSDEAAADFAALQTRRAKGLRLAGYRQKNWRASFYKSMSTQLAYLSDAKLPLLPSGVTVDMEIALPQGAREKCPHGAELNPDFVPADNIIISILENVPNIDAKIPRKQINHAAKRNEDKAIPWLKAQVHHDGLKDAALELLQCSKTGVLFREYAGSQGYELHFVDLEPWNMISRDKERRDKKDEEGPEALALCSSGAQNGNHIFVDGYNRKSHAARASYLAHEDAHAWQYNAVFRLQDYPAGLERDKAEKETEKFLSTMEAHAIGIQYIVGAEQVAAGVDVRTINKAVRQGLSLETIDLLMNDPARFLRTVAASNMVRDDWALSQKEMTISDDIIRQFAANMPPLCMSWKNIQPMKTITMEIDDFLPPIERWYPVDGLPRQRIVEQVRGNGL